MLRIRIIDQVIDSFEIDQEVLSFAFEDSLVQIKAMLLKVLNSDQEKMVLEAPFVESRGTQIIPIIAVT